MNPYLIFFPLFAMVLLTFLVWIRMYLVRVAEIKAKRINPQKLSDSRGIGSQLEDVTASDNFRNLFELPVLFYTLCLAIFYTGLLSPALLLLCWVFVISRYLHSLIHVTYNRVMHRFQSYVFGGFVLFAAWCLFAWSLFQQGWVFGA